MNDEHGSVLYAIVCGAGPAGKVGRLVQLAQTRGWDVWVVATPAALDFLDVPEIEDQTGHPVRSEYHKPGEHRSLSLPKAHAIVVAPATYNTINKWARGISDTFVLGILAEASAFGIPVVVVPFVNTALARRRAFQRSVTELRMEGIRVLLGPDGFDPHPPGTGESRTTAFPWYLALDEVETMLGGRPDPAG